MWDFIVEKNELADKKGEKYEKNETVFYGGIDALRC